MNNESFEKIVEKRLEKIKTTLIRKSKEYALNGDRLHNFKVAARLKAETPEQALWGMAIKHLVNIEDLITGRLDCNTVYVDEKLGDMMCYLILLEALLLEKNQNRLSETYSHIVL